MNRQPSILAFAGSSRKESLNKKLVRVAALAAEEAGAKVRLLDLGDFPMPLYNQDLENENGLPGPARELKKLMIESDGLMIASPEYNSSITPLLKNTIDWVSRPESKEEPSLAAFRGKTAALMSASPGALGGLRGLVTTRSVLENIGVLVLPGQRAVSRAHQAFDTEGRLKDDSQREAVEQLARDLVKILGKLS